MRRPLEVSYLRHAVRDVEVIHQIYDLFSARGYLYPELAEDSMKYVSIWEDARPKKYDCFRNNGFLPLGIIDRTWSSETGRCMSCMRCLPKGYFSESKWRIVAKRQCFVCRAVAIRNNHY
jgi:exonuclease 3'-5' domain-containing protein 1